MLRRVGAAFTLQNGSPKPKRFASSLVHTVLKKLWFAPWTVNWIAGCPLADSARRLRSKTSEPCRSKTSPSQAGRPVANATPSNSGRNAPWPSTGARENTAFSP
ncbi:unannotated protein [freshwater metagenome]|uniref:Unannotated protein n=1 Tax=freshwater metagenome TaxID=449393 RepID=A0A6J7HXH6_9ZZZZ